jgi:hypothetical protein
MQKVLLARGPRDEKRPEEAIFLLLEAENA